MPGLQSSFQQRWYSSLDVHVQVCGSGGLEFQSVLFIGSNRYEERWVDCVCNSGGNICCECGGSGSPAQNAHGGPGSGAERALFEGRRPGGRGDGRKRAKDSRAACRWRTERVDHGRRPRRNRPELCGQAGDPAQRRLAHRQARTRRQAGALGVAAGSVAAGGSRNRSRSDPEAAGLRPRREPGELVSRLCSLLWRDGQRQELVCRGGAGCGAQAGSGQEAGCVRLGKPS